MAGPNQPTPVMAEDGPAGQAPAPPAAAPAGGDASQTAELPMAMFGGKEPKEGDVFEFKVVSLNTDSGTVTIAYNSGSATGNDDDEAGEAGGADGMAAEFSKEKMAQKGGY